MPRSSICFAASSMVVSGDTEITWRVITSETIMGQAPLPVARYTTATAARPGPPDSLTISKGVVFGCKPRLGL